MKWRAENLSPYLTKGQQVYVEGRMETRSYDDQETGKKVYVTDVIADEVFLLGAKNGEHGGKEGKSTNGGKRQSIPHQQGPPAIEQGSSWDDLHLTDDDVPFE